MHTLTAKHPRNLGLHYIIKISSILHDAHIIPRNQERIVFYVNNYIDWNQFNQLYALNWLENGIQNADAIAWKFTPASTKATNLRKKETRKKREVVDQQKVEAIAEKQQRDGERSSLSIKDDRYYDNQISANSDKEDSRNLLKSD